ncbi:hypothetical protein RBH29_01755 [Herbivorax sp. ANBcel31]|uniref:hypothetical protein n=1 Tax=Herbivorax sp. ANBcel31 TaxID=3069754 RepID=UPI0027B2F844|nr:hypothetical protein [Herbivorax sp. ANBcel31]MDQ2085160.1 hypothetical protein [Herbivorax sp. ANBcel31]
MTKQKKRVYKYAIFISILGIIVSGINYVAFKVPAVGVAFIMSIISSTIVIIAYNIEK